VSSTGAFFDQIELDQAEGGGDLDALGALHGEFAALAEQDVLLDLSDLAAELDISPALLELGRLGTDTQYYVPWMQATYVMAANRDALQHLPEGADINALTWDQWRDWGKNILEATGERRLGLPLLGGPGNALHHRLLQGHLYPSFTGGVNTEFATEKGLAMWDWLKDTWQYINPNATYTHMQVPLQNREVDVAWDHTARLIEVLRAEPQQFVAFPSPAGPEGRGFMPVVAGLGIPKTSGNIEGAKELIRHYLKPETQGITLEQISFFPVLTGDVPANVDEGLQIELDAVTAQASSEDALPSLLPIGLGAEGAAYNYAFQDTMNWILVLGYDAEDYLTNNSGPLLQTVLDKAGAPCWVPDPDSGGETCQVGGLD
jgi:multiple sugar transport system substrate-binding protein